MADIENIDSQAFTSEDYVFPSKHYIPKDVTQQSEFLKKYPEYDGRNTLIAILDTGVDPSLPGMQVTSTGLPKLIDCMDLTGAGDVDTSTIKEADKNGIIIGLTERELKIPKSWNNPSGKWHLGMKPIYELYEFTVKKTMEKHSNESLQKKNKAAIAEVMKELAEHVKKVGNLSKKISDHDDRENITSKLDYLKNSENVTVESPVADCIVWFDGEKWQACVDTSFTGELENAKVMTNYREERQYAFISDSCMVAYCVNIHQDGNILEICVPSGSHGSHVANICAGFYPDNPEKDGLAPGAQIISMCIGDMRRYSSLTEQAFVRALNKCMELKVDAINMSFGGGWGFVASGNTAKLVKTAVKKHGILFFKSAGNSGPALSTLGDGRINHSVINVGAYLTAEMKKAQYSQHEEDDSSVVFPFSSRGPCLDGTLGVCICAPGAAIAGVTKFNLKHSQQFNGTSMSSPNACGAVACLISGLKANSLPVTPFSIKTALMNTALIPQGDTFDQHSLGYGILQVDAAFDWLKSAADFLPSNLTDIKINAFSGRGIYLREPWEATSVRNFTVKLKAKFKPLEDLEKRINFECPIVLKLTSPGDEFIKIPKFSRLPDGNFKVNIDPMSLENGKVHYTEVSGINPERPSLGPLFRVPITVIIPDTVTKETNFTVRKTITLIPAVPCRYFITPPIGSTSGLVTLASKETQKTTATQLSCAFVEEKSTINDQKAYAYIKPQKKLYKHFWTPDNHTLEFCVTQFWNGLTPSTFTFKLVFRGFHVETKELNSINPINQITFTNHLRCTTIFPTLEFTTLCEPIQPAEAVIEPMEERDFINNQPTFRLLLTYKFCAKAQTYSFVLDGYRTYFKYFDCFLYQISTASKQHVLTSGIEMWHSFKAGDYVIRFQIRHSNPEVLEKLKSTVMLAKQTIPKIIASLYTSAESAFTKKNVSPERPLSDSYYPGETGTIYVGDVTTSVSSTPGSFLTGKFSSQGYYDKAPLKMMSSVDIKYYIVATPKADPGHPKVLLESITEDDDMAESDKVVKDMKIAVRDAEIPFINKLTNTENAVKLFERLSTEYPAHLPILSAEIERLSTAKDLPALKEKTLKLLELAEYNKLFEFHGYHKGFHEENVRKGNLMTKKLKAIGSALYALANLTLDEYLKTTDKDIPVAFRNGFNPKKIVEVKKAEEESEVPKDDEKKDQIETAPQETSTDEEASATKNDVTLNSADEDTELPKSDNDVNVIPSSDEPKHEEEVENEPETDAVPKSEKPNDNEVAPEDDKLADLPSSDVEDKENKLPAENDLKKVPSIESIDSTSEKTNSDDSFEKISDNEMDAKVENSSEIAAKDTHDSNGGNEHTSSQDLKTPSGDNIKVVLEDDQTTDSSKSSLNDEDKKMPHHPKINSKTLRQLRVSPINQVAMIRLKSSVIVKRIPALKKLIRSQ